MDGFADGASLTGNSAAGRLSTFVVNNTTHTQLGASFSAVGLAGSELDSGTAPLASNLGPCSEAEMRLDFIPSGGLDSAVLLGRQEIGGDLIPAW